VAFFTLSSNSLTWAGERTVSHDDRVKPPSLVVRAVRFLPIDLAARFAPALIVETRARLAPRRHAPARGLLHSAVLRARFVVMKRPAIGGAASGAFAEARVGGYLLPFNVNAEPLPIRDRRPQARTKSCIVACDFGLLRKPA